MPCYDPPRPDRHDYNEMMRQRDKYVECLKDIEDQCKSVLNGDPEQYLAQEILLIIDRHFV
jgi:hypothetical protein